MEAFLRLVRGRFVRDVTIVAGGTAGAQVITMAFAPVVTRMYGPEAFGLLGAFTAIVAVAGSISALCYPMAIVMARDDVEAMRIARLAILVAVVTSASSAAILFGNAEPMLVALNLGALMPFVPLVPVLMLSSACLAVLTYLTIRARQFKVRAAVSISNSFALNVGKVGLGSLSPSSAMLIIVSSVGSVLHAVMLYMGFLRGRQRQHGELVSESGIRELAVRYRDFPMYRAPQVLINGIAQNAPTLMLASLFGAVPAGFYALARAVLGQPARLVASSISDVFYPKIAEVSRLGEDRQTMLKRATAALALGGAVPFGIIVVVGPDVFSLVFGSAWLTAGEYARWLSISLYLNVVAGPCVAAIPALGLQRGLVIYEVAGTSSKLISMYFGLVYMNSDVIAVALFSVVGAIAYGALIGWVIRQAGRS